MSILPRNTALSKLKSAFKTKTLQKPHRASSQTPMAYDAFLEVGADVEVTSTDHCLRGTLFPVKIVEKGSQKTRFVVEYTTLKTKNDDKPLREEVELGFLRPLPPRETNYAFKLGDKVDAFFTGGWWEGEITEVLDDSRFDVYFRFAKQQFAFGPPRLRLHREWDKGNWVPALHDGVASNTEEAKAMKGWRLDEGTLVEISCDEDGLKGAWFAATIIKMVEKDKFLIQYKKLRTDDDKQFLTEEVDKKNIRPYPPEAVKVDDFKLNEEVDAWYNDGWWEGVICKILRGRRYQVYFKDTDDHMIFKHSELRPRQEWIDETWAMAHV